MFTGIIEDLGKIISISRQESNLDIWLECAFTHELKVDQSLAHNGICLTVVEISGNRYRITAVAESIAKTNIATWKKGDEVNLERALKISDRLDGHFVQGHVDATGVCIDCAPHGGSWIYLFEFPEVFAGLMVEKGSICVNGVSLTAFNVSNKQFNVAVIPYTYTHTNFAKIASGSKINLEFDILGKYLLRQQHLKGTENPNH